MGRKKLKKFAEVEEFENAFIDPEHLKGKWAGEVFGNDEELVLELGCGHGNYARELAEKFPKKNFVGVDRKGDRIWSASVKAGERENVAFAWCDIKNLPDYFAKDEVAEIWITFPDPYSKPCKHKQRLVSKMYLELYKQVIKKGGTIHFKTDNEGLFDYGLEVLETEKITPEIVIRDVHGQDPVAELLQIKTYYEEKYIAEGKPIFYTRFKLTN